MFGVRVQTEPIFLGPSTVSDRDDCGAQVRFVGTVRNDARGAPISHLMLEHFPGVTESEIERILDCARERWHLHRAQVIHRVGRIDVGEDIVMVETAAPHRKDAYEANVFIMDYLKTQAPFWKQECFTDGTEVWVEAKQSDELAAQRWSEAVVPQRIGALILAGGRGSRMGHRNKGLQRLRRKSLVAHVADAVQGHVAYLAISANHDLAEYEMLGLPVFKDEPHFADKGPLAGIASALPKFPANLDALLVLPCDVPLLPEDLVPRLAQALGTPTTVCAIAATPGNTHHGIFMCRPGMLVSLLPHLQADSGQRLLGWLQDNACVSVEFDAGKAFCNVNDMATLHSLEAEYV